MRRKIKKIGLMKVQVFKKKREKKDSPYPRKRIKERVVHEKDLCVNLENYRDLLVK
jgi:hypothetical protein